MSKPLVTFFGDHDHEFALSLPLILELEHLTGSGIGALMNRVVGLEYRMADLVETIRLGLIGGGMSPELARRLVDTYAVDRPVVRELQPVATAILNHLWSGPKAEDEIPAFIPPVPPSSEVTGFETDEAVS